MTENELRDELTKRLSKYGDAVKPNRTMVARLVGVPLDDPARLLLCIQVLAADVETLQEQLR